MRIRHIINASYRAEGKCYHDDGAHDEMCPPASEETGEDTGQALNKEGRPGRDSPRAAVGMISSGWSITEYSNGFETPCKWEDGGESPLQGSR